MEHSCDAVRKVGTSGMWAFGHSATIAANCTRHTMRNERNYLNGVIIVT